MIKLFQVIKRVSPGEIMIEFPLYTTKVVPIPVDNDNNMLIGLNMIYALNSIVEVAQQQFMQELQPTLHIVDELAVTFLEDLKILDPVASIAPITFINNAPI